MRPISKEVLLILLERFRNYSRTGYKEDVAAFMPQIQALINFPSPRIIIGVVGDTGSGKSSLINALLEEEQLVSTSGMKACTAVVTEIQYNFESEGYRAEIRFLGRQCWKGELEYLFTELEGGEDDVKLDDEAMSVWEKVKAVYPGIKQISELRQHSVNQLIDDLTVGCLFDQVIPINASTAPEFNAKITEYLASRAHTEAAETRLQYWPLIEAVSIYIHSPLLLSGVVLVDLPGTRDSNAGRSTIADRYLRKCTHFLVVAGIKRAVDNATARDICSGIFDNRMAMDGMLEKVAFVCTQTDDINKSEIYRELPRWDTRDSDEARLGTLKTQLTNAVETRKSLKQQISVAESCYIKTDKRLTKWEERQSQVEDEGLEFPLYFSGNSAERKKRKREDAPHTTPTKRSKEDNTITLGPPESDDENEEEEEDADCDCDDEEDDSVARVAKNGEDLDKIIKDLKAEKKALSKAKSFKAKEAKLENTRITALKAEIAALETSINNRCILARNEFSKAAIRRQYASSIKAADDESFANADPDSDLEVIKMRRDYGAVERSFPVFCVSSRAYQRFKGRLGEEKDDKFKDEESTEIPALQRHLL
ncbi:hypothetical protein BJ508DRAFT_128679 [Ascobolus immersus RN42]|uniref:Dynamin N-terminal domain-containing protein n=1 Tax=Ascobolus immersus RN42 TaxID=1160509 RepID=A0A3N4I588_ASCIM|nr:hypothetical protein BJ508DRAFT_128679 [Ascobolus immersus RN42]